MVLLGVPCGATRGAMYIVHPHSHICTHTHMHTHIHTSPRSLGTVGSTHSVGLMWGGGGGLDQTCLHHQI